MNEGNELMSLAPAPLALVVFLAFALVALSVGPASAQTRVSPDEVVQMALGRNPSLKSAAIDFERAKLAIEGEESRFLPTYGFEAGVQTGATPTLSREGDVGTVSRDTLSGSASISQQFSTGTTLAGTLSVDRSIQDSAVFGNQGATYGVDLRLEISQPWLKGAGDRVLDAGFYRARYEADAAAHARDREASALVREVLEAYWELWYAQRTVEIRRDALELAQSQLAQGQVRVDAGAIAATDLLPLRAELASLAESLGTAKANVRSRSVALSSLVDGTGVNDAMAVAIDAPTPGVPPDLASSVEMAEANSLDLARFLAAVEVKRLDVVTAEDNAQIQLDTFAWVQVAGLGQDSGAAFGNLGTFDGVSGFVGVRVAGPFDGGFDKAETRRARLAVSTAELDVDAEKERLLATVRQQVSGLEAAYERLELSQATLDLAEESTKVEEQRFAAGATTALDVVNVLQRQREAELRRARARVDIRLGHVAVDDLTGDLLARVDVEL